MSKFNTLDKYIKKKEKKDDDRKGAASSGVFGLLGDGVLIGGGGGDARSPYLVDNWEQKQDRYPSSTREDKQMRPPQMEPLRQKNKNPSLLAPQKPYIKPYDPHIIQNKNTKSVSFSPSLNLKQLCPQAILIGPFDTMDNEELENQLQNLMQETTKSNILEFIKAKSQKNRVNGNMQNIEKIKDEQFWMIHTQNIIDMLLTKQHLISGRIRLLPYVGVRERVILTRQQIFMLICAMFFSIIPEQFHTKNTSLAELMSRRPADSDYKNSHKAVIRLEKLRCVVNYMKYMNQHPEIYDEEVVIERAVGHNREYLREIGMQLGQVEVRSGKIEEGYEEQGAMVDFANAEVGGGFLGNGSAQEQILFSIFPELTVVKLICEELREEEAVVVRGARRFNTYEGYSKSFRFLGDYGDGDDGDRAGKSVVIAVDAVDFSKGLMKKEMQYQKKYFRREMHKFFVGVEQALDPFLYEEQKDKMKRQSKIWQKPERIFTGRWGCGIFGANEYLKFCIQWIICSFMGVSMVFYTDDEQTKKELRAMVRNLEKKTTFELINLIDEFGQGQIFGEKGLLSYFKEHA